MKLSSLSFALRTDEHDDFEIKLLRTRKIHQVVTSVDILIDGKSLLDSLKLSSSGLTTWASSHFKQPMLTSELYEQLTKGIPAPELVSGIVPVYICSECGDYGCGVFGWKISFGKDTVIWSDFGWDDTLDDDITEDEPDPLYARKAITFDRTQYFNALDHIPSNDKLV